MSDALFRRILTLLALTASLATAATHTAAETTRVSYATGSVHLLPSQPKRSMPLIGGASIQAGDEIVSGAGTATIELNKEVELRLFPRTRLQIVELASESAPRVRLIEGKVHARAQSGDWNPLPVYIETSNRPRADSALDLHRAGFSRGNAESA
ncbi:hypothetical protein ACFPTY_20085 [Halomonas beimenensis]|uniref:hypothetical protein n=1 Tax=Halomonas beimenensis TaxID=475662 RepID=UPI00360D94A5